MSREPAISRDDRVRAVLTAPASSQDAAALLAEVEAALAAIDDEVKATRQRALDPLTSSADAEAARAELERVDFDKERLAAQVAALAGRARTLRESEQADAKAAERSAALKERDELAEVIRTRYPELAAELADIASRIVASDARVQAATAGGLKREASAEAVARGCAPNFALHGGSPIGRISEIRLPALDASAPAIWPPRNVMFG
jgi:hypothetical protein